MKNNRNDKLIEMQKYLEELKVKASKIEEEKKHSLEEQEKNKQEHKLMLMKRLEELKGRVLKQQEEKRKLDDELGLKVEEVENEDIFPNMEDNEKSTSNDSTLNVAKPENIEAEIAQKIVDAKKIMIDVYSKEDEIRFLLETDVNVKNDFKSLINVVRYISRFDEELNKEFNDQKLENKLTSEINAEEEKFSMKDLDELISKKMSELFGQGSDISEEDKINSSKIESDLEEISRLILK